MVEVGVRVGVEVEVEVVVGVEVEVEVEVVVEVGVGVGVRVGIMTDEIFMFCDTETNGFRKSGPLVQNNQARVCQIGMILCDATGKIINSFSQLVKPDGWTVSQFNIDSCGITQEACEKYGMPAREVFEMFVRYASMATVIVAHNSDFDKDFCEIEAAYADMPMPTTPWFCTMKPNTHIAGGKWPKLTATLKHFCDRELGNVAHNAMYDVEACKDIFFAMKVKNGW